VRLDVADGGGLDVGVRQRRGDHGGLRVDPRRGEPDTVGAVVVDRGALDDGVDVVAVGDRVGERLQHHQPNTVATHRAGGVGVEGAAVPVRGQDPVLCVEVAAVLLLVHRDTARQRDVALASPPTPAMWSRSTER